MSEKPLSGNVLIRARLQLGADDSDKCPTEYFVALPDGDLQPISEKDAHAAIARAPQMARVIELLLELGKRQGTSREDSADDLV